jgi:hypothetical protein
MKLKRFNELNEKVEISVSEIKELFTNGRTVHRGLTDVNVSDNTLTISHSGNMGNSITRSVDPNINSLGLPTISDLKKQYKVISEEGSPDYLYTIEFDLSDEKNLNESVLNESTTEHFVVNSDTKRIVPSTGNSSEYWRGNKKGTIDMEIEVFGYNHREEAKLIYDALKAAGLENRYFRVTVEPK